MSASNATGPAATFASLGLPPLLVQSLNREKITAPFPIQAAAIPDILAGRDVLGRGPTGSGKTLAFGLPMLVRLKGAPSKPRRPRALVLAPTRELALQIESALEESALSLGLRLASVVGGMPIKRQIERLGRGVDLLVATPGRLADLIAQGAAELGDVRVTTIDEADHMSELGFLPQVTALLDQTAKDGQRLLFSATLDGEVDELVRTYLSDPVLHATAAADASVDTMTHHLLYVNALDKSAVVAEIAARPGKTLLFVRTKLGVDRWVDELRDAGVEAVGLHGDKTQANRNRTLALFSAGSIPVLVATDVAARGIHVDGIGLVAHVDPPADPKDYLHRAGRTARAGEAGAVVTIVTDTQRDEVARMTRKAGLTVDATEVKAGSIALTRLTGSRKPSGVPLPPPVGPEPTPPKSPTAAEHRRGGRPGAATIRSGARRGGRTDSPGRRGRGSR